MRLARLQETKVSIAKLSVSGRQAYLKSALALYASVLRSDDHVLPAQRRLCLLSVARLRPQLA
jgi:hypothetical protein